MLPEKVFQYLLIDLDSAPEVLTRLLSSVTAPDTWDRRPDPDRFSLREMVAHLADWEGVFLGRLKQTRDEENAMLQGLDEGQIAIDHDYAHAEPQECLARYRTGRTQIVDLLRRLSPEQRERVGAHTEVGPISLEAQAVLIAAHDGYHRRQAVEWLAERSAQ